MTNGNALAMCRELGVECLRSAGSASSAFALVCDFVTVAMLFAATMILSACSSGPQKQDEAAPVIQYPPAPEAARYYFERTLSNSGQVVADPGAGRMRRLLTGESLFTTVFTNKGAGKKKVAFGAPYPGKIIPVHLSEIGGQIICQKDAFLCAAKGVSVGIAFQRKIGVGLFGGEGFIMQRLQGDGWAFIHAGGTLMTRDLAPGERLRVDTGCVVGYAPTEVTIAAYAEFLAARVTTAGQGKGCEANMSYAPACFDGSPLPGKGYEKHPVSCVDWCDASAYCKWAGKHICLGFLESPLNIDEWDTACEGLGPQPTIYPYGDVYNAQVCNVRGNAAGKGQTWEAGANGCESSHFPGLFDLSGNVAEWSRCSDQEPAFCPLLGGSYLSDASTAGCMPGAETIFAMKNIGLPDVGFRCCR